MKDAIDKRNERERYARTIVKRRNIIYTSKEQLEYQHREERRQQMEKDQREAGALIDQLLREKDEKSASMIEQLLKEQSMLCKQLDTGTNAEGQLFASTAEQQRIEEILNEKNKALQELVAANSLENREKNKRMDPQVQTHPAPDGSGAETGITGEGVPDMQTDQGTDIQDMPDMDAVLQEVKKV